MAASRGIRCCVYNPCSLAKPARLLSFSTAFRGVQILGLPETQVHRPLPGALPHYANRLDHHVAIHSEQAKRKYSPEWSLTAAVFMMVADPGVLTRPAQDYAGVGLATVYNVMDFGEVNRPQYCRLPIEGCCTAREVLQDIHARMRHAARAPAQGILSQCFEFDKRKGIHGLPGLRHFHTLRTWWRNCFRHFVLHVGSSFEGPPWAFGCIRRRRRDGLIALSRTTAWKARKSGLALAAKSYNMRSAFHSGRLEEKCSTGVHGVHAWRLGRGIRWLLRLSLKVNCSPDTGNHIGDTYHPRERCDCLRDLCPRREVPHLRDLPP